MDEIDFAAFVAENNYHDYIATHFTWVGGTGKNNPFFGKRHPPKIIEIIRKASTGRPKTAEELAKLSAAMSGPNNHFFGDHHADVSKRKMTDTKIRNGTLGRFPEKTLVLLRIAKELDDAGIKKVEIASLALNLMREGGMKISKVQAYRVLPQKYKNSKRVVSCSSTKSREWESKRKNLDSTMTERCFVCGSDKTDKDWKGQPIWYRPNGQYQCNRCFHTQYNEEYARRPHVRARDNESKKQRRVKRKALGLPYQ